MTPLSVATQGLIDWGSLPTLSIASQGFLRTPDDDDDRGDGAHSYGGDGVRRRRRAPEDRERFRRAQRARNALLRAKKPKPERADDDEVRKKVTEKILEEAIAETPEWVWPVSVAESVTPKYVAVPDMSPSAEYLAAVAAVQQYLEAVAEQMRRLDDDEAMFILSMV